MMLLAASCRGPAWQWGCCCWGLVVGPRPGTDGRALQAAARVLVNDDQPAVKCWCRLAKEPSNRCCHYCWQRGDRMMVLILGRAGSDVVLQHVGCTGRQAVCQGHWW